MPQLDEKAKHLEPVLRKYGATTRSTSEAGGWSLSVVKKGRAASTYQATFNSSASAYAALMKKPLTTTPKAAVVPVVRGPRVMFGVGTGIDAAIDGLTTALVMKELREVGKRQREDQVEEDSMVASAAAAAAQQASARAATRVRERTMTKRKHAGRVRVHGYSRRLGETTRDFRRKSPRK